MTKSCPSPKRLVICVRNKGFAASLEKRKVYVAIPDSAAVKHGHIRVIDESGKDYLYPENYFVPVTLPQSAQKARLVVADDVLRKTRRLNIQTKSESVKMIRADRDAR
ncbi:MAG: hypothetical protein ACYC9K_12925 [Sulfuricaulis sp.]